MQVPEGHIGQRQKLHVLENGLRQYVAKLNSQTIPQARKRGSEKGSDSCQDLHSECPKWAVRVRTMILLFQNPALQCS